MTEPVRAAGAAVSPVTVGQIGLAEAGNLGDDLILIAAVRAIAVALPTARVRFLSHGLPLDWGAVHNRLSLTADLEPVSPGRGLWPIVRGPRLMAGCSAVVFGGGGLLQTSHHPLRPYHWLRYLGVGKRHPPAIAVGLGLGPLDDAWQRRLARGPRYFDQCWVRDDASLALAQQFGWPARRCSDFVDAELLGALGFSPGEGPKNGMLGIALRSWPGLDEEEVALHVERVAERQGIVGVEFFVLESKNGRGPDVDFTQAVSQRVRMKNSVTVYNSQNLFEMLERMMRCSSAISMKLHAGVVWGYAGATIYPIIYAPKVAALFGRPYRGLEVLDEPVEAAAILEADTVPSAHALVRDWLLAGVPALGQESALNLPAHLGLGVRSNWIQVGALAASFAQKYPRGAR